MNQSSQPIAEGNTIITQSAWSTVVKVGIDLFSLHGQDYLMVVDYHSKFFEVTYIQKPAKLPVIVCEMKKCLADMAFQKKV